MPAPNWTTVTAAALAATMGVGGFMQIDDGSTNGPVEEIRLTELGDADGTEGLEDATRRLVVAAEVQTPDGSPADGGDAGDSTPTRIGTIPPPAIPVSRPVASAAPPPPPPEDSGGSGGSTAEQPAPAPAPEESASVDSPADPAPPPDSPEPEDSPPEPEPEPSEDPPGSLDSDA